MNTELRRKFIGQMLTSKIWGDHRLVTVISLQALEKQEQAMYTQK